MARTRTKPPEVRRRDILDAARKSLIARGYHDVHLDDVAAHARVSKGALYLHFKDKESIFAAVLEDVIDRLEERLEALPANGTALEALTHMAAEMLDFVDEHQDFLIQFSREKPDLCGTRAGTVLQERYAAHLRFVSGKIARCVEEGSLRKHDPALGGMFLISLVRMFMLQKIMARTKDALRPKSGQLMDLFLHGLGGRGAGHHA